MENKPFVLLVGQVYLDTILHVNKFPEEDTKIRATYAEQRVGGNTCNTAQVLAQFHHQLDVCYMSAVGSHETSSYIMDSLKHIKDTMLYREEQLTPSSVIIHNQSTSSRTIISNNNLKEIDLNEFIQTFDTFPRKENVWVHFEGRNIHETIRQIEWLNEKAAREYWRSKLTISVELEKPERPDIHLLAQKGDVVFFSKIYAQHHGYQDPSQFLIAQELKPSAFAFCTWGAEGAVVFDNKTKQTYRATPPAIEKVVDTVGAGDTFIAGIIYHLTCFGTLEHALNFGCQLATRKVAQQGFDCLSIREEKTIR
ncbi:Ribokinase-like protein [Gilbertella persicaria]|uniref:Ribokinase-like protein n=1 Tax=Gilbertella persicaria TaxID=101096 RepID=UPI0022206DA7|nr:Ribokinase-like protein [Gilbertella persicaria]KAI8080680.1 Ribokinase-like protein [Gilbertella persicaria]